MDVLIPSHQKDFLKLPYVVNSLSYIKDTVKDIFIVSPVDIPDIIKNKISRKVLYYKDSQMVDNFDRSKIKYRPNWIFQMILKLTQDITRNHYLCVDSDLIFNRPIRLYSDGKPTFLIGENQNHEPYFNWMRMFAGLDRQVDYSFINEVMLFDRHILMDFFTKLGYKSLEDIRKGIIKNISSDSYPSEFEFFGNLVKKHHPDRYNVAKVQTATIARHIDQFGLDAFSEKDILQVKEYYKDKSVDWFTLHSWT